MTTIATVTTPAGGIFIIEDAFLVGTETVHGTVRGEPYRLNCSEGEVVRFSEVTR